MMLKVAHLEDLQNCQVAIVFVLSKRIEFV